MSETFGVPLRRGLLSRKVGATEKRMRLAMLKLFPTVLFAVALPLVSSAKAAEYRGTCYFNSVKMPCSVSQNPFTLTMRWADGVTETYIRQGSGENIYYTDKRGGIWRPNLNVKHGLFLNHKNGNSIGFVEN